MGYRALLAAPRQQLLSADGSGEKDLVAITLHGSDGHPSGSSLVATQGHPFWVVNLHAWVLAGDLQPGDQLLTPTGALATVQSLKQWTALGTFGPCRV